MNPSPRQLALRVHRLAPSDREWILGALSERERGELAPLLTALQEMGVPQEADFDQALDRALDRAVVPVSGEPEESAGPSLDAVDASALAIALRGEPSWLVRAATGEAELTDTARRALLESVLAVVADPAPERERASMAEADGDTERAEVAAAPRKRSSGRSRRRTWRR